MSSIAIIGGGLAGSEAAFQLGKKGHQVDLYEMRPKVSTPAHKSESLAELVCSNSLKSLDPSNAHGLLKAELELADSLVISAAKKCALPAGSALAVDRERFSAEVEKQISQIENIRLIREEVTDLNTVRSEYKIVIIAGGPLLSDSLAQCLGKLLNEDSLFFYDAIAPVVYTESINMNIAYKASRYGKGEADYINCPLNKEEYYNLIENLVSAKKMPFKEFEKARHFEGCLPIEVMAERGVDTLSFGPMKPVGLEDPKTGQQPWAVLQLRQENELGSLFNLVGCQTRMTWPEQKRVFQMIPGLEDCEFARFGSMHRNTYICAPTNLNEDLELRAHPNIFLAGQLTGIEGYVESTAMGMWCAMKVDSQLNDKQAPAILHETMIGGLVNYLMKANPKNFQPMNANFGLINTPGLGKIKNKKEKRQKQAEIALSSWAKELKKIGWV